jgi:hypothetical protein
MSFEFRIQSLATLINTGVGLSAINPEGGPFVGARVDGIFACIPITMDRERSFAFGSEMMDAAGELQRMVSKAPLAIGARAETDFPRVHYLSGHFDLWGGLPEGRLRTRMIWTREQRDLAPQERVGHGDSFTLVCVENSEGPRVLNLGKGYRGFRHGVVQSRQISAASPLHEADETSELLVGGDSKDFWRAMENLEGDGILSDALWIAALLYAGDPIRYEEGFEFKVRRRAYRVYMDDRGLPCVPGLSHSDLASLNPRTVRSLRRSCLNGSPESAVEIHREGSLLYVRERRVRGEAGSAHDFLIKAAVAAKRAIDREMSDFNAYEPEIKLACLERERQRVKIGGDRLL